MENSLVLSHLPRALAFNKALCFLRELDEPPSSVEIARALCSKNKDARSVWDAIETANRQVAQTLKSMAKRQIHAVDYWSIHYPRSLRELEEPPWVLYFIGEMPTPVPTLAIVGTRKPNTYGRELLAGFIPNIKIRPLQIVSGLAYGIDALAHFHACESQIPNFAIMGCGLDMMYPASHASLATRILESKGGLLSEYPPGTEPMAYHFPRRNRIISGLADAVWIVQGTAKSGTVHTLDHALAQSKQVLATPGDVFSELAELPNKLLYDGALIVLSPDDIDLVLHRRRAILTH